MTTTMTNAIATKLVDLNDYRGAQARTTNVRDGAGTADGTDGAGARILLFTGIRYERMDEPVVEARRGRA